MKLVIYHGADGGLSAGLSKILAVEKYQIFCDRGKNFNILTLKNFCGMEFFCSLQDIHVIIPFSTFLSAFQTAVRRQRWQLGGLQ